MGDFLILDACREDRVVDACRVWGCGANVAAGAFREAVRVEGGASCVCVSG